MDILSLAIGLIVGIFVAYFVLQSRSSPAVNRPLREAIPPAEVRRRILLKHEQLKRLGEDLRFIENSSIRVGDVMTESVCFALEDAPSEEIFNKMQEQRTRHLIIQDHTGRPTGIVSNRDPIVKGQKAKDVMTPDPITVSTTSSLGHAVALMLSNRISCLPVTDEDVLRGIITTTDLLMVLDCLLEVREDRCRVVQKGEASVAPAPALVP